MALLNFNYGLLEKLPSTIKNGHLYITTDSQGLYVDLEDKRYHISDFIQVADMDALSALGSYSTKVFYYVEEGNALLKYTGVQDAEWKQLNSTKALSDAIDALALRVTENEGDIVALQTADEALNTRIDELNATDIETTQEITVTTAVGNYAKGAKISADTDLQTLILNMLCKDSNPTATQPSLTMTLTGAGAKEVGTTFTPSYSASGNAGEYKANGKTQASGVTFSNYAVTEKNRPDGATASTGGKSGTFNSFVVTDDADYYVSGSADNTQGDMPKTYLGNDYSAVRIAAGTVTKDSTHVTGYRPIFYGILATTGAVDSAVIRGLTNDGKAPAAKTGDNALEFKASTVSGAKRFIVAIPASSSLNVTSAIITSSQNADATSDYVKQTTNIEVQGADGYTTTKPYKVWVYEPASIASVEVHKVTIS